MCSRRVVLDALLAALLCGCAASPPSMQAGTQPAAHAPVQRSRSVFTSSAGTREYVVALPGSAATAVVRPMLVVLHGCLQSADDIARGTRFDDAAARGAFVVLYPEQPASAHPQRCWNWFTPSQTARGRGEVSLLAEMIDSVARRERVDPGHIALVGMSAGAAMVAYLAIAYPERYAALALHSGVPAGAAHDLPSALRAMGQGASDGTALGDWALSVMTSRARPIPTIVLHGALDKVVSPINLTATAEQWTHVNARAPGVGAPVEQHLLEGVGHAWSGGSPAGSYTAPQGPDATAMILAFFRRVAALPGR